MENKREERVKPCVILFAEITQIDTWKNEMDTEEYFDLINRIFEKLDEAVRLYEGHIDKHEGRVLMATFGVPVAHEEDPERAIKAGLLMLGQIAKLKPKFQRSIGLRIGINLGRVYATTVGSRINSEYTVICDAVNFSARIMEFAKDNELLVSDEIYQITKPVFEFSEPIKFLPQGARQEIVVYNVYRQKTGFIKRRGIEGLNAPLIDRKQELLFLLNLIEELFRGNGNVVFILGEAGIGKSRLIEELFTQSLSMALEQVKNINWCIGRCSPYRESPYHPFVEIIKQICDIRADDSEMSLMAKLLSTMEKLLGVNAESIFPYIAEIFNIKLVAKYEEKIKYLKPEEIKLQIFNAIGEIFDRYAEANPTVFCIDDLYLADETTLEIIQFLLQTRRNIKALIILISRPEKNKPFWEMKEKLKGEIKFEELYLNPLTRDEIFELSKHLLKISRLPENLVNKIINDAGGNPFFLEELIKLLISKGVIFRRGNEWFASEREVKFEIPYTIEGIIQASYDTLNAELRDLLSEMAVLGRTFNKKLLSGLTRHWEKIDELMVRLIELGYISTSNYQDFAFNHALVRESIYKSIPQKRLKELHFLVARTIESLFADRLADYYDILFEHYASAEHKDKAVEYAVKAGANAAKRYANTEAISYYLYILKELKPDTEENKRILFDTMEKLGKIYSVIGNSDDALAVYEQALRLAAHSSDRAKIYNAIADTYQRISDYERALEFYNESLKLLVDNEELKLETWLGIAWIYYLKGDMRQARELLEQILESINIKGTSSVDTRKKLARVYNQLGSIYSHTGEYEKSFESYTRALKIYEMLDDLAGMAVIYNNIHGYYTRQGDYYQALDYLNKSLEIDIKTGNLLARAIATYNIGETYLQLGDYERAQEKFYEYLKINAQINNRLGNGYGNYGLARIYLEKGDLVKAEEHLVRALEIFQKLGSVNLATHVMITFADLEVEKENFQKALSLFEELLKKCEDLYDPEGKLSCIIGMAKTKLRLGMKEKKLMIGHLCSSLEYLKKAQELIREEEDIETKFVVNFYLARINFYLTKISDAREYFVNAENFLKGIISKIPEGEPQQKFLQKKIYREFSELKKEMGL
ncbi:MAG: tetratricopeptide repeat protein [candidate division WOR-3 bacterium]|nr:tetratricopeptide repeat protein [candidate division WOR-3 bacterium]